MSTSIDRVRAELEGLGYSTTVFDTPRMPVVSFDYVIEAGSNKGTQVTVALGFQEDATPNIPPIGCA